MARPPPIPPAHLADDELRIAADWIRPVGPSAAIQVSQVPQKENETVIFRDVAAPHRAVGRLQVRYVANRFLLSDHEGRFHGPFLRELIAGTGAIEEAHRARTVARCGRVARNAGGLLRIGGTTQAKDTLRMSASQFAPR